MQNMVQGGKACRMLHEGEFFFPQLVAPRNTIHLEAQKLLEDDTVLSLCPVLDSVNSLVKICNSFWM